MPIATGGLSSNHFPNLRSVAGEFSGSLYACLAHTMAGSAWIIIISRKTVYLRNSIVFMMLNAGVHFRGASVLRLAKTSWHGKWMLDEIVDKWVLSRAINGDPCISSLFSTGETFLKYLLKSGGFQKDSEYPCLPPSSTSLIFDRSEISAALVQAIFKGICSKSGGFSRIAPSPLLVFDESLNKRGKTRISADCDFPIVFSTTR